MKNLMPLTPSLAFICLFLFSCDSEIPSPVNPSLPDKVNTKIDFSGIWVATHITYIYEDESTDVSQYFPEMLISVDNNHSLCILNNTEFWFSASKWGDHSDTYFSNQENRCAIQIQIIESNHSEIEARIENLMPYLYKLIPEEKEDGYYLATFRRYNGQY